METSAAVRPTKHGRARRTGVGLLGFAVSAASLFMVARSVDLAAAARAVTGASVGLLLLALAVILVPLGLRFITCSVLIPDLPNGGRVPVSRLVSPVLIGYLGNLLLPARLGEVVRAYLIARQDGLALGGTLGAVALERVLDTTVLAVMAAIAAAALGAEAWIVRGTAIIAAVGVAGVVLLATVGLGPLVRALQRVGSVARLNKPVGAIVRVMEPFAHWSGGAHRRRAIGITLVLGVAAWLCSAAMFWLIGLAVGATLSPAAAVLVMAVTVLATAIPAAPGYVGTYELAAVAAAGPLGVPPDVALALAVLAHVVALLPTAVGGSAALLRLGGGLGRLSEAAEEEAVGQPTAAATPQ